MNNKNIKITVKNNNGTEFSYWMHYKDWVAEQEFIKKKKEEIKVWWANNSASLQPKMVKLDGESMKTIVETLLQTKEKVSKKERNI